MCLPGQADHHASVTVLSAQSVFQANLLKPSLDMKTQSQHLPRHSSFDFPGAASWHPGANSREACRKAGLQLYLHVDQQLPQVAGRHHDGGVELDDVALVQCYVMIRRQTLRAKHRNDTTEPSTTAVTVKMGERGNSGKTGLCVKQTSLPSK